MDAMEMMMRGMRGGMKDDSVYPTGKELDKIRKEFVHIPDLKPGDKLRWKSDQYKDRRADGNKGVLEVFRVLPKFAAGGNQGSNHEADEGDFTVLSYEGDEKKISEFVFDSRRFERV